MGPLQVNAPKRRFTIDISIGADDWDTARRELLEVADHIAQHGPECSSVSGGYSAGHAVTITERPEMTHDSYFEALEAYLAGRISG